MSQKIVRNKKELEKAVAEKVKKIIVVGDLAKKVDKAYKIKGLSKRKIALISSLAVGAEASIATAPLTGGVSMLAATPAVVGVAALTGIEIVAIMAVLFMGISLILLLAKEYKKSKIRVNKDGEFEVVLEKEE